MNYLRCTLFAPKPFLNVNAVCATKAMALTLLFPAHVLTQVKYSSDVASLRRTGEWVSRYRGNFTPE